MRKKIKEKKVKEINLLKILKQSFELLKKEPKLFLPKMIIAILYGLLIIFQAQLLIKFTLIFSQQITPETIQQIQFFLISTIILLITNILIYFLDTLIISTYPSLVKQFPKKISFKKAINESKKNYLKAINTSILILLITIIFTTLITIITTSLIQTNPLLQIIISLIISFILIFLFYLIFPILMLEKKSVFSSIKKSINLSFKNKKNIFLLSFLPITITLSKLFLAIFITHPLALILFIILILLTGILHTYSTVTTQTTYFSLKQ